MDLLEKIQERIEAEIEIKHSNKRRNNNNFKANNWSRKKDHNHLWKNALTIRNQKNTRGRRAASATVTAAERDPATIIVAKMIEMTEAATGAATDPVIVIPGGDTTSLAKAITERSLETKQGVI